MTYEEECRQLDTELEEIRKSSTIEDLNKRFCRNFGCINFRDDAFYHELALARRYHAGLEKTEPTAHKLVETEPYRCYHRYACKCGFREECDSSD